MDEDKKLLRKPYWYQLCGVLLPDPLIVAVLVYTFTGVVSPTLIDYISHTYETDQWALLPVMSTAVGLSLVVPLSQCLHIDSPPNRSSAPLSHFSSYLGIKTAFSIAGLDMIATSLVTIGLVNVGSATYTVIYSSAAAWTALMSWRRGHLLSPAQVFGVTLVTFGLLINGIGHVYEDETRTEAGLIIFGASCIALVFGTVLHSVVMVRIDEVSKESKSKTFQLATSMGRIEVVVLLLWNLLRILWKGFVTPSSLMLPFAAIIWFLFLSINQSLHSLAFFSMIGSLGAVGSAVLKGFLALNTFGLAAALFCEKGHSEQCLTPLKTTSMLFVFIGGLIYGIFSKKNNNPVKEKSSLPI